MSVSPGHKFLERREHILIILSPVHGRYLAPYFRNLTLALLWLFSQEQESTGPKKYAQPESMPFPSNHTVDTQVPEISCLNGLVPASRAHPPRGRTLHPRATSLDRRTRASTRMCEAPRGTGQRCGGKKGIRRSGWGLGTCN